MILISGENVQNAFASRGLEMQLSDRMVLTFPIGGREMAVLGGSEVETL
jgi:hypothetical protein